MKNSKIGVVFKDDDYAGLVSRIVIMTVDLIVIFPLFVFGYLVDSYLYENYITDSFMASLYLSILISYIYLTVIKASKYGTFGQRLTNTKIVHISGKRPNILHMTYRLLFWILGPVNFVFDFAWVTINKEKRTLRDSICNTIVVKKNAEPVSSSAEIHCVRTMVFGFNFLYDTAKP